jgi:deoxycytidine triphosphate deaminase
MVDTLVASNGHPDAGILVDRQILDAISSEWLKIDPFSRDALEPATYDLCVGDTAVLTTLSNPVDLRERPRLIIEPFSAALLQTDEILTLSSRIVGRLGPRSNILSRGIFVSTGPQIDPGFHGRLFVTLINMTDHPFLIGYLEKFLTVEFHGLSQEPSRLYRGPHQNKTQLSSDDMNAVLGRGGPAFKEIHRELLELLVYVKDIAEWGKEVPALLARLKDNGHGSNALVSEESIKETFDALAQEWREDTRLLSSVSKMVMHSAYQKIIGMGEAAIPLLLRELEQTRDHWLWALAAISREDPASPNDDFDQAVNAWLDWGRQRGYIN